MSRREASDADAQRVPGKSGMVRKVMEPDHSRLDGHCKSECCELWGKCCELWGDAQALGSVLGASTDITT